jgi:hypothetical protein
MGSTLQPAAESSVPTAHGATELAWFSNKELRPLAWTITVALCAGLMHFLGAAFERGRLSALSIYGFSRPTFDQEYLIYGATAVLVIVGPAITVLVVAIAGSKLVRLLHPPAPSWLASWQSVRVRQAAWWIGIITVIAGLGALNTIALDLSRHADGMILKQADVGNTWMNMVLDEDLDWFSLYWFGLCGGMALFVLIASCVIPGFKTQRYKALFVAWLALQVVALFVQYSYILGATQTIGEYPLVSFSNAGQLLGKGAVPILIGEDDKQFAILVVYSCASQNTPAKTVLYLPRSEVKWMGVVGQEPLHLYAHIRELSKRSLTPCEVENPSPPPSTPK